MLEPKGAPKNFVEMLELSTVRNIPAWRIRTGPALNLGAGNKFIAGSVALDRPAWEAPELPYAAGCVSTIYAIHFLEHLLDPRPMLMECQRVLEPQGLLNIAVPYYSAAIAHQDLDHKSYYTEETWKTLFDDSYYGGPFKGGWQFDIGVNVISGIVERNMLLITQLIRR